MSDLPDWAGPKWLQRMAELQPETFRKFVEFEEAAYGTPVLPEKFKQLIAVAVTHATQCELCMEYHTDKAKLAGATDEEIVAAVFIAAELRAGAAIGHHGSAQRAMERHRPQDAKAAAKQRAA